MDIQLFQNAFVADFPAALADQLLSEMENLYGAEFHNKFKHIGADVLRTQVCKTLSGITPKQLRRGLDRMRTEDFCPALPRFKKWCIEDPTWWTAEQAWAKALQFEVDPQVRITKLTKVTLDEVRHILDNEGQKAAHRAFKDIYTAYLTKALEKGREQEMYQAPVAQQLGYSEVPKGVPCPADLAAKIKSAVKKVGGVV